VVAKETTPTTKKAWWSPHDGQAHGEALVNGGDGGRGATSVLNASQHVGWTHGATVKVFDLSLASKTAEVARNTSSMVAAASSNGVVRGRGSLVGLLGFGLAYVPPQVEATAAHVVVLPSVVR
jgi:hypothetical protein